jgi:hypothetical protein
MMKGHRYSRAMPRRWPYSCRDSSSLRGPALAFKSMITCARRSAFSSSGGEYLIGPLTDSQKRIITPIRNSPQHAREECRSDP